MGDEEYKVEVKEKKSGLTEKEEIPECRDVFLIPSNLAHK